MAGVWKGTFRFRGEHYRVVLHVARAMVTLDSPDTGQLALALPSAQVNGDSIAFALADPKVSFQGKLSADGSKLTGTWSQEDRTFPLTMLRLSQAPTFYKNGHEIYRTRCASCHAPFNVARAPTISTLWLMPQARILAALETGKMRAQGEQLSQEERVAVAAHLGVADNAQLPGLSNTCSADAKAMVNTPVWNGWGGDSSNSRFQPAALAGLDLAQIPKLRVKWAFGYPGATSGGGAPTIVGDRIFVAGGDGRVYSLDMRSGCMYWSYLPLAPSRTAITVSSDAKMAYFGDSQGRAYAVDTATGALVWKTDVETHAFAMVTGAPKLHGDRLYVPMSSAEELGAADARYSCCTLRGSVSALDAKTGNVVWKTYTISKTPEPTRTNASGTGLFGPSGASVWSSPTIDPERQVLYVGTGENHSDPPSASSDAVMALDLKSGKILWVKQLTAEDCWNVSCLTDDKSNCPKSRGNDFDVGAPPVLRTLANGKRLLVVGQKSGVAYGLDPDAEGKIVWAARLGKGGSLGGIEFGGAADDKTFYVPLSDWERDPKLGGGMFALEIATGKKLWSTPAPPPACLAVEGCSVSQQAPATLIPGVVFSGALDGHLRAYDAVDGKIVWDFDTTQEWKTVNQLPDSHGGSINYAGTVVASGMLFVTSGYSLNAGMPGNVLLAFSVDGK